MAQPIRNYTPHRNEQEELRGQVEHAPVQHAKAVLAAYDLLQEAQDHGVLDTLRGAIGAGDAIVDKVSEFSSTPEGIRAMRNFLALSRVFANLDPEKVDAVANAITEDQCRRNEPGCEPPSLLKSLQRMNSRNSRRTLATIAAVTDAFGTEPDLPKADPVFGSAPGWPPPRIVLPLVALTLAGVAGYWIGRRR
ncbi:MAG TPA: hypothetical protein VMF56_06630 [Acidobacteriaceae bacterium]|nr:hypothetical protein [Acidobacteriaceae bacterium]